jgi:PAS domain S-box-containing protein
VHVPNEESKEDCSQESLSETGEAADVVAKLETLDAKDDRAALAKSSSSSIGGTAAAKLFKKKKDALASVVRRKKSESESPRKLDEVAAESPASSLERDSEAVSTRRGTLKRKGAWSAWRERYYVAENGLMMEYASAKSTRPRKVYKLDQFGLRLAEALTGQPLTLGLFSMVVARDPIYFQAGDKRELVSWVRALQRWCGHTDELVWEKDQFLEALNDGVVLAGVDGTILGVNSAFLSMYGYARSDLMGSKVTLLMEERYAGGHGTYMCKYMQSGVGRFIGKARRYSVRRANGELVRSEISLGEMSRAADAPPSFIARFRIVDDAWVDGGAASGDDGSSGDELSIDDHDEAAAKSVEATSDANKRSKAAAATRRRRRGRLSKSTRASIANTVDTALDGAKELLREAIMADVERLQAELDMERDKNKTLAKKLRALRFAAAAATKQPGAGKARRSHGKATKRPSGDTAADKAASSSEPPSDAESSSSSSSSSSLSISSASDNSMNFCMIDCTEPRVGERLASAGGSGAGVYVAVVDGWQCVVKELNLEGLPPSKLKMFEFEVATLESLPVHRNLVRYLFHRRTAHTWQLFMTRYDRSLTDVIRKRRTLAKPFAAREIARFMIDICRGVGVLHDNEIIHRDLKSYVFFLLEPNFQD